MMMALFDALDRWPTTHFLAACAGVLCLVGLCDVLVVRRRP